MVILGSFSQELDVIHTPSRCTSMVFFVLNRIWNLVGLTFVWLLVNQEKSLIVVDCSCVITLSMSSVQGYGVVSLAISESSHSKKRSIKSTLNSNGPKIGPCGTPYSILLLSLQLVLILTGWVRFER